MKMLFFSSCISFIGSNIKPGRHFAGLLAMLLIAVLSVESVKCVAGSGKNNQPQKLHTPGKKSRIVFLVTEDPDNYEAHKTVPIFAGLLRKKYGFNVTVLLGNGAHGSYQYPQIEILSEADLLIIFARRIALPHEQMNALKKYLHAGKPIIGIRTANHAFTVREQIKEGYEDWPGFVADILGCENRGYGAVEPGTDVSVVPENAHHPIVKNISPKQWHSKGNVYLVAPLLDKEAIVLLTGKVNDLMQPIAWTRTAGKSKVFYTSMGFPDDFKAPQFNNLLVNAIQWALVKD